jgi:hypothetical protein
MIPLAAFEEIIDASGTAPRIEVTLPIGVRPGSLLAAVRGERQRGGCVGDGERRQINPVVSATALA